MATKIYICRMCLGTGFVQTEDEGTPGPCPTCIEKGWPPTLEAKRGEEPIYQVNVPVEVK
jgi:hypothetical protein